MKKEMRRILSFAVLSLFLVILASNFVFAQENIFDPVKDMFANWEKGNLSTNVAKYLFTILLALLIWSIIETSGMIKQDGVRWIISIIVAFLGTAYLTPNEVWATLISYSALGMTLLFLFPLIIMFFFTVRVIVEGGASGLIAQYFMWIIYLVFLGYRFVSGVVGGQLKTNDASTWVFLAVIGITFLMVVLNGYIRRWLGKEFVEAETESTRNTMKRAVAMRRIEAEGFREQARGRGTSLGEV